MDLSVQKMRPPASVQGKSAAKRTSSSAQSEDAVETASEDQKLSFKHGNTAYDTLDADEQTSQPQEAAPERQKRRKRRQLMSNEDLRELTQEAASMQNTLSADGLMNMRAYQTSKPAQPEPEDPHFDKKL